MITYILVALCFLVGIFLQRFEYLRSRLTSTLNNFAIYIALPAIILAKVPQLQITFDALFLTFSAWAGMALSCLVLIPLGKKLLWERDVIIICVILSGLGNTAFLGMAMIKILFNDQVLGFAVLYDQLGSFLILSFALPLILALKDNSGQKLSIVRIGKNILLFPPFVCLIIAIVLPISNITQILQTPLNWLGLSLLPLAMLIVGLQFHLRISPEHRTPIFASLGMKMFLFPALVTVAGMWIGIPKQMLHAGIIQSAMPPMVTPAIFLISLNLLPRLSASILSLGTAVSFVTIPAIAFLIN